MGTPNLDIKRFEVTGVFTHPSAHVDIVLVHGLNGEPRHTWTAANGLYWPVRLLPEALRDTPANVLVYGYNADVYSRSHDVSPSDNYIFQHAQSLVAHLTAYRRTEGTASHPLIWIAHSLGGILVKRALLYSNDLRDAEHDAYRSIYVSTYGIIFLGTPHNGSGLAVWGRVLQAMSDAVVPKKFRDSESVLLKTLKRDNERLQEINNHFLDIYQRFRIHMVHESHKTDLKGTKALVVDADSASPQLPGVTYYGIEATHSGMCKFAGPDAPGYRTIAAALREWVADAPQVIDVRWTVEREDRVARAERELAERRLPFTQAGTAGLAGMTVGPTGGAMSGMAGTLGGVARAAALTTDAVATLGLPDTPNPPVRSVADAGTSPMPLLLTDDPGSPPAGFDSPTVTAAASAQADPVFMHPDKFRPNSYFVGRQKELVALHDKLTDKAKRAEGSSAVVIHSPPGGGKTHLAREYVYRHMADYPGGIYWVRAKSIPEMEQFYWRIARTDALRDVVARTLGASTGAGTSAHSSDGSMTGTQRRLSDPQNVVDIVRNWFGSFNQWLLVFDGILFNTPGIDRFIPDTKNTSLIYTSIQSDVSGRYKFDNPQILKLGMLRPEDAQTLLLTEMERRQPWTQDDRARADELVKLMGCLPLMVHIAAQHLKATREPLAKYLRTYRTRIHAGDLSAYRAVWDELKSRGAYPALNLMYILAFFDNRIPVGLLNLGLGALDSRTPVMTRDAAHRTKSLNNSLRTLIAFALLDRAEGISVSPTSSQSSAPRSDERALESVDLLRIYTVVQLFFVDVLAADKQADFWLERATSVYCRAFDEAYRLIQHAPKVGLLDDYRCFQIHGEKLLEHLSHADKKDRAVLPPLLANARSHITSRLSVCEQAIVHLAEATQVFMISEMTVDNLDHPSPDDYAVVSVFDRASSMSDSEESPSPSSQASGNNSGTTTRTGTGFSGERTGVHIMTTDPALRMDIDTESDIERELGILPPCAGDSRSSMDKGKTPMDPAWAGRLAGDAPAAATTAGRTTVVQLPGFSYSPMVPGGHDPCHFHVPILPYPPSDSTIPGPPPHQKADGTDDGTSTTEVPTPHVSAVSSPELGNSGTSDFQPGFGIRYAGRGGGGGGSGSAAGTANHRTVRRNNAHRYHDHAGAWRDKTVSDPRISVSREFARGLVYMPGRDATAASGSDVAGPPGKSRLSAGSEAELALSKLRVSATASMYPLHVRPEEPPAVSDAVDEADDEVDTVRKQNKGRAQSTGTQGVRPLMTLRQNASAPSGVRPAKRRSPSPLPRPSPPSTWKSTLKRLRETILPSSTDTSSAREGARPKRPENARPESDGQLAHSVGSLTTSQPGRMFHGSRSASSTPNQGYGPFQPPPCLPSSHHHCTPFDGGGASDLPAAIRQWGTQVYHPGHQRLSSADLSYGFPDDDPMAATYPQPGASRQPHEWPAMTDMHQETHQQLLQPARFADGYTSQPMSRNASAQSQTMASGGPSRQHLLFKSSLTGMGPDGPAAAQHSYSQPQPAEGYQASAPVAVVPPLLRRNSRSSLVETEPSPQTYNPFAEIGTSYRRYEERHVQGPYSHSYRVTEEVHHTPPGGGAGPPFRPTLGTIPARTIAHDSAGGLGIMRRPRAASMAVARSQSDSLVLGPPGVGMPAPYPTQLAGLDGSGLGSGYTSEPMSRHGSGNDGVPGHGAAVCGAAGRALQGFGSNAGSR